MGFNPLPFKNNLPPAFKTDAPSASVEQGQKRPETPELSELILPKQAPMQSSSKASGRLDASVFAPTTAQDTPSFSKFPVASPKIRRIGDVLIEKGFLNPAYLAGALAEAKATGATLGTVVTRSGWVTEEQLGICLADLHGLEYIRGMDIHLKPEVVNLIPVHFIKTHLVVPHLLDVEKGRLEVIIAHPDHTRILDDVALMTRYRIVPKVCTTSELTVLIDQFFATKYVAEDLLEALEGDTLQGYEESSEDTTNGEVTTDSAPVVQFVNVLLSEAVEKNASDIHLEPQPQRLLIRFRIDGILQEMHSINLKMAPALVSRLKVMAKLDVSERRRPQDGRLRHQMGSVTIDMRLSTIPLQFGEKMVIRVLKLNNGAGQLNRLGLSDENFRRLNKMIRSPHGILLVTGPTGSGKTTTLYGALRSILSPECNISTIEDPIEYVLAGVNQMQVQPKAGLTFASSLRALLRQDPDVIMLGEIRDAETLEASLQAAMTGHLVLSTVHANSCAKTIARLLDMGAPPYLVSTAVVGIVAQRLVRSLCPHCKTPHTPTADDLELLHYHSERESTPLTVYEAVGCEHCEFKGYKGRQGIYEVLKLNRELARLIDTGASTVEIEDLAISQGMKTLEEDAIRLVRLGTTTTKEVRRTLGY